MKILIYSSGKIPSQRAHSINIIKHAQAFNDLNHKVEVYSTMRLFEDILKLKYKNINKFYGITSQVKFNFIKDLTIFYFKDIIPYIFRGIEKQTINDNPLKGSDNTSNLVYFSQKIMDFSYNINLFDIEKKISTYCRKNDFDLCYTRDCRMLYYNTYNKIPTILESHDPILWKPKMKYLLKSSQSEYFKSLVTISQFLKNIYIQAGIPRKKILVVEDAVDIKNYESINMPKQELRELLKLPKKKKIILYTGSLFEGRGIDTIIDAADILNDINVIFYIIGGNNKEIRKWQMYKAKKKNHINLKFLGFIQNSKIPFYHKAADILLAPYTLKCNNINWMSPIKLFEYMASKIPIIASDVKRIREICNKGESIFFKESDPFDLAEKIRSLLDDYDLGHKISEKAFQTTINYSYEKRCQKIIKFIQKT